MHLEEKAAQIVDLFARLGGCWSTLSTPPRYGPAGPAWHLPLVLVVHGDGLADVNISNDVRISIQRSQ